MSIKFICFKGYHLLKWISPYVNQKCHSGGLKSEKESDLILKNPSFSHLSRLFFPFADGKIFAISNGKSVSYDR